MAPISERAREEYGRLKQRAPKILVVDDKVDTLLLLRELLSSRGYDIITATEAEEAKQMVHTRTAGADPAGRGDAGQVRL